MDRPAGVESRPASPPERQWRLASFLVSQVAGHAHPLILAALGPGRTKNDYAVLATLVEFGPMSQATLGRRLNLDRSDISGVLDKLEAEGLARREPDELDHRRNVTTITLQGTTTLRGLDRSAAAAQDELLRPLSIDERQLLVELLTRLVEYHTGWEPGAKGSAGVRSRGGNSHEP